MVVYESDLLKLKIEFFLKLAEIFAFILLTWGIILTSGMTIIIAKPEVANAIVQLEYILWIGLGCIIIALIIIIGYYLKNLENLVKSTKRPLS